MKILKKKMKTMKKKKRNKKKNLVRKEQKKMMKTMMMPMRYHLGQSQIFLLHQRVIAMDFDFVLANHSPTLLTNLSS